MGVKVLPLNAQLRILIQRRTPSDKLLAKGAYVFPGRLRTQKPLVGLPKMWARVMKAADLVRTKLLKSGNDVVASSWDVAPSAMSIQKRRSLTEALGGLLNGKTLSDLLMGDRPTGGGGNGTAPRNGAEAEMQAVVETYKALRTQLVRQILSHKHWRMLPADELASLRHALETALEELPAK